MTEDALDTGAGTEELDRALYFTRTMLEERAALTLRKHAITARLEVLRPAIRRHGYAGAVRRIAQSCKNPTPALKAYIEQALPLLEERAAIDGRKRVLSKLIIAEKAKVRRLGYAGPFDAHMPEAPLPQHGLPLPAGVTQALREQIQRDDDMRFLKTLPRVHDPATDKRRIDRARLTPEQRQRLNSIAERHRARGSAS